MGAEEVETELPVPMYCLYNLSTLYKLAGPQFLCVRQGKPPRILLGVKREYPQKMTGLEPVLSVQLVNVSYSSGLPFKR